MCGIFAYMGPKQAAPILMEGLRRLEYRGYDSSGIALKNGDFSIFKKTGKVAELQSILPNELIGNVGIAHTRWATHGGVTDPNAHPHLSEHGKVVIVHNGIIENSRTLRTLLQKKGVVFNSETDSEVISHILEYELGRDNSPTDALRRTLGKLVGTWGLCAIFIEHDVIMCARNGSPLIIGQGDGEVFVSSDPHALATHTQRVVFMDDGDIATLTRDEITMSNLRGESFDTDITVLEEEWQEAELGDFEHYMLKEIYEQPDSLRQCINGRLDRVRGNGRLGGLKLTPLELSKLPHVRLLGCGTAYHAAEIGGFLIESLARIPSLAPVSYTHLTLPTSG